MPAFIDALIMTFASTTDALAAEKAFRIEGLPGRLIPLPGAIAAGCGLCWKTDPGQKEPLLDCAACHSLHWEQLHHVRLRG